MKFKNIDSFNPQECLSGQISRIHRLTAKIFRNHLAKFGVTNSQVTLLFILSKKHKLTQKQLAEIAKLEKSSLHRNLKRLVDSGLVGKNSFPLFSITDKGIKLVNDIIPEWEKAMGEIRNIIGTGAEASIIKIHQKLTTKEV